MERVMKSQTMGDMRTMEYMKGRKIMEINPEHDIIKGLKVLLDEQDEDRARDLSELLFETSLLTSGFQVDAPREYAAKVFTLMKIALGYDISGEVEDGEVEAASSSSSSNQQRAAAEAAASKQPVQQVVPEVMDPNDPWFKNNGL